MSGSDDSRTYLVESYWPGVDEEKFAAAVQRAQTVAAEVRRSGRRVEFRASILVPTDETILWLFDGAEDDVRAVGEEAEMPFERVLASLRIDGK